MYFCQFLAGAASDDKKTTNDSDAWATAIKQALMPVTPQSSSATGGVQTNAQHMAQLKVPMPGETGHLGLQIQSEHEFSQLYQIFADEILGSGQFGTVYGGK